VPGAVAGGSGGRARLAWPSGGTSGAAARLLTVRSVVQVLAVCLVLLGGAASGAVADSLLVPVHDGRNLAGGGGWLAWGAPLGHSWNLVVRSPGGTVGIAHTRAFGAPPDASIGSVDRSAGRWVAVYSRCLGRSAVRGCDLYEYDLLRGQERKLSRLSTASASERAPSVKLGAYAFSRAGGQRPGTYTATAARVRRVDTRIARETALSGTGRVAYVAGGWAVAAALSGGLSLDIAPVDGFGLFMTAGARVGWLERTASGVVEARRTARLRGPLAPAVHQGLRFLSATTDSVVPDDGSQIAFALDAGGVSRVTRPLFYP